MERLLFLFKVRNQEKMMMVSTEATNDPKNRGDSEGDRMLKQQDVYYLQCMLLPDKINSCTKYHPRQFMEEILKENIYQF